MSGESVNPNDGSFHETSETLRKLYASEAKAPDDPVRAPSAEPPSETLLVQESVEDKLVRAATKAEEALLRCPELPPHWPRFAIGECIHIKGHKFVIDRIEQDALVLKMAPKKEKP